MGAVWKNYLGQIRTTIRLFVQHTCMAKILNDNFIKLLRLYNRNWNRLLELSKLERHEEYTRLWTWMTELRNSNISSQTTSNGRGQRHETIWQRKPNRLLEHHRRSRERNRSDNQLTDDEMPLWDETRIGPSKKTTNVWTTTDREPVDNQRRQAQEEGLWIFMKRALSTGFSLCYCKSGNSFSSTCQFLLSWFRIVPFSPKPSFILIWFFIKAASPSVVKSRYYNFIYSL